MASLVVGAGIIGGIAGLGFAGYYLAGYCKDPKERFKQRAKNYFNTHAPAPKPDLSNIIVNKDDSAKDIAQQILKDRRGFIIGQEHTDTAPREFLFEAMDNKDITCIFMEYLDDFQKEFDDYIDGRTNEIPPEWKKKREKGMFKLQNIELEILKKARKNKQKIICLDSSLFKRDLSKGFDQFVYDRVSTVNYHAINKITDYLKNEKGKFIAYVGAGHASTYDKPPIPGIGPMLGVPSIFIKDDEASPKDPPFRVSKVMMDAPTEDGGYPDMTLFAHPIC